MNAASSAAGSPGNSYLDEGQGLGAWFSSFDHKKIAMMFLAWTLGAFLLGAIFSTWLTLKSVGGDQQDAGVLFQIITYHRLVLVFLFLVPAIPSVLGFFLLPGQIGASEFAFPTMSRCSLRFYVIGLVLVLASVAFGPVASGWTLPTPLVLHETGAFGLLAVGLFFVAGSWFATGVNFVVTIHHRRAAGMGFFDMPLLAWSLYLGAFQLVFAGVMFAIVILYLAGGQMTGQGLFGLDSDPLLWQKYFWFAMRPAAFFALIPAAGVISAVVAGISRKPVTAYRVVVGSLIACLGIGLVTWGVHLAGLGQAAGTTFAFSALALLAVVPVALIAYCWLATLYQGANHQPAPTFFVIAFFLLAGVTVMMELFLRSPGLGAYLGTTMFASAQMDYLIWGAVMTALLAGLHYWWPTMTGRAYRGGFAVAGGLIYLIGLNLALIPHILLGTQGVAADMMVLAGGGSLPGVSLLGWALAVLGWLMVLSNLASALMNGERVGDEAGTADGR
jgi:cytochrome c oxidase subunit I